MIPHEDIEAFVEVFAGAPRLAELELRTEGTGTLRLRRSLTAAERPARPTRKAVAPSPAVVAAAPTDTAPVAVNDVSTGTPVTSTLVGVFRPAAKAPVAIGSMVRAGQTLGYIEAMRLMNDVNAPTEGVITAIRVQEGQPVEYGQPLFELDPVEPSEE